MLLVVIFSSRSLRHCLQNLGFDWADRDPSQTTTEQPLERTSQGKSALAHGFRHLSPDSTQLLLAAAGPMAGQEGILPSQPRSWDSLCLVSKECNLQYIICPGSRALGFLCPSWGCKNHSFSYLFSSCPQVSCSPACREAKHKKKVLFCSLSRWEREVASLQTEAGTGPGPTITMENSHCRRQS